MHASQIFLRHIIDGSLQGLCYSVTLPERWRGSERFPKLGQTWPDRRLWVSDVGLRIQDRSRKDFVRALVSAHHANRGCAHHQLTNRNSNQRIWSPYWRDVRILRPKIRHVQTLTNLIIVTIRVRMADGAVSQDFLTRNKEDILGGPACSRSPKIIIWAVNRVCLQNSQAQSRNYLYFLEIYHVVSTRFNFPCKQNFDLYLHLEVTHLRGILLSYPPKLKFKLFKANAEKPRPWSENFSCFKTTCSF